MQTAQIHRFRGSVALYVGNGQTVYIDPKMARAIARSLNACVRDIKKKPKFYESDFQTVEFKFSGEVK